MSNTVKVRILDKVYDIACSPGKETYVEELGKRLNEKVHVISGVVNGETTEQHIVVTALFLMEEVLNSPAAERPFLPTEAANEPKHTVALGAIADHIEAICERLESLGTKRS